MSALFGLPLAGTRKLANRPALFLAPASSEQHHLDDERDRRPPRWGTLSRTAGSIT